MYFCPFSLWSLVKSPKKVPLERFFIENFSFPDLDIFKLSIFKSQKTFCKKIVLREPFFGTFLETFFGDFLRLFRILFRKIKSIGLKNKVDIEI